MSPLAYGGNRSQGAARRAILAAGLLIAAASSAAVLASCGGKTEVTSGESLASPGYCAKACAVTLDCCPEGDSACPGDYPHNFVCETGLCRAPQCQKDVDCAFLAGDGGVDGLICGTRGGHRGCLRACASDADCASAGGLSGGTCADQADDGTRICGNPTGTPMAVCESDADCPAGRHCQSGTCGCAEDAECKPKLDVCTTDRDFAYPSSAAAAPAGD